MTPTRSYVSTVFQNTQNDADTSVALVKSISIDIQCIHTFTRPPIARPHPLSLDDICAEIFDYLPSNGVANKTLLKKSISMM